MMTLRSKHVALNDIYLVVLTVYLHSNNNYWWFVKLMSKVVSEDGQRVRHMQVTTSVPKKHTVFVG